MLKKKLHAHCDNYIREKLKVLERRKKELKLALDSEDKSSAGDKHETGRAMIQIEREKNSNRIKEIESVKKNLVLVKSIEPSTINVKIGSIIFTKNNNYFISISSEIYKSDIIKIYCISPNTPIAKAYLGKKVGNIVNFNDIESKIEKII